MTCLKYFEYDDKYRQSCKKNELIKDIAQRCVDLLNKYEVTDLRNPNNIGCIRRYGLRRTINIPYL